MTFLEEWLNKLPEIPGDKVKVISDEDCAPELSEKGLKALEGNAWQYLAGWHKQQLIKFACAWVIKTCAPRCQPEHLDVVGGFSLRAWLRASGATGKRVCLILPGGATLL